MYQSLTVQFFVNCAAKLIKIYFFRKRMTRIYHQENYISDGGARYENEDGGADEDGYCDGSE